MREDNREIVSDRHPIIPLICSAHWALFADVPGNELIGNVIEVLPDDVWLRTNRQHIVPGAPDKRAFPTSRDCAERVPGVAGDQAKPRRSTCSSFST
jgi:hypothetical protein